MQDCIKTLAWTAIIEKLMSVENFIKLLTAEKCEIYILALKLTYNPTQIVDYTIVLSKHLIVLTMFDCL